MDKAGVTELGAKIAAMAASDASVIPSLIGLLAISSPEAKNTQDSEMESLNTPIGDNAKHSSNFSPINSGKKRKLRRHTDPAYFLNGRTITSFDEFKVQKQLTSRNVPGLYTESAKHARARIAPGLIRGGYAICAYLGVHRQTLDKWIRFYDFPAAHLPDGALITTPTLVDAWVAVAIERERERLEKMPELRKQNLLGMKRVSGFRAVMSS